MVRLVSPPAPQAQLQRITAAWRYSNGGGHFAYDYAMPAGTKLFAIRDGIITDCADGVVDHTPGRPGNYPGQNPVGSPSNWVLLQFMMNGKYHTVYYQHLLDTQVRRGQAVKAGQVIGLSGQTGNATGNHLHIALMHGGGKRSWNRYDYMLNDGATVKDIWPPSRAWGARYRSLGLLKPKSDDILIVQQALKEYVGLDYSSGPRTWGPKTQAAWIAAEKKSGRKRIELLKFLAAKYGFAALT